MKKFLVILFVAICSLDIFAASDIVVVRPVTACKASDRNYGASLSKHIVRWLGNNKINADLIDDTNLSSTLAGRRIAFLVMSSTPTKSQISAISQFRARGGKLCVFYSQSPQLASLMGIKLGAYVRPGVSGAFAKMIFNKSAPVGAPLEIMQTSSLIFSAYPIKGKSKVSAVWANRSGASTGYAAVLSSSAGWWVTHIFLADGNEDAKANFLLSVVGSAIPGRWNAAAWRQSKLAKLNAEREYGKKQTARVGEIHAVWDHSGQGMYPGDWRRTMLSLKAANITDVFVNVAGAGFAHYPSKVLPASSVVTAHGDQLAACINAARGTGIRVHAWILCFTGTRSKPAQLAEFSKKGWRLKNPSGGELEYLDPSNPAVQTHLLNAMDEIVRKYPVDGVHLDFVRWYEKPVAAEKTPATLARFQRESKVRSQRALCDWRVGKISSFVAHARNVVKRSRPKAWLTTAVLGKYPSCVDSVGQDWESWMDAGLVDYIVPMNYTQSNQRYASYVNQQGRTKAHARKVISGIGVTANESRLTSSQVIDQINLARKAGLAGVALFDLDYTLITKILPILRLGMF